MFFSVVVPVYNVEKYLSQCIDSVLSQTYTDFELILVDDGSKDSSGSICDEYALRDIRVKVIHKENGGQASARNVGISVASGEYVVFIDSDDFFRNNLVLKKYRKFLNGQDFLCSKYEKYFQKNESFERCTFSFENVEVEGPDVEKMLMCMIENGSYSGTAWAKAIRRDFLLKNEIFFDPELCCEDMDWFFRIVTNSNSMVLLDEVSVAYRQREGSVTSVCKMKTLTDFVFTLEKWSGLAISNTETCKKRAVLGALAKYYADLLVVFSRVKDFSKKQEKQRVKQLSFLLEYGLSRRPICMRKVYRVLGFDLTIFLIKIVDKLKG